MKDETLLKPGVTFLWLAGQAYQKHLGEYPQLDPLPGKAIGERVALLKKEIELL